MCVRVCTYVCARTCVRMCLHGKVVQCSDRADSDETVMKCSDSDETVLRQ